MNLRYQVDEKPPLALALGLGFQLTTISVFTTILVTTLVMRAGGQSEAYLVWAVFAAVMIGGATSILQVLRLGRIGVGHVLLMGSSTVFIAVGIEALTAGGPSLFATVIVAAGFFQFLISYKLAQFRRIFTPTVSGTVLMLLPVSVMPAVFNLLEDVPENTSALGAPLSALVTVAVICGITLRARNALRLWAPIIGIIAGSLVASAFGQFDTARVSDAAWIGLPEFSWPGINIEFDAIFWALLPASLLAATISAIRTASSAVAIQNVSWRKSKAVDYRAVQGAVTTDSLSNLLSGLAGTMPNSSYATGASLAQITGVAARSVGLAGGAIFLALAFFPKILALVLAIPGPVFATFLLIAVAMLFIIGMQMVIQDGIDYRKSLIVGIAFWAGVGFQNGAIYPEIFSDFAHGFLNNGITAGALVAIFLTLFMKLTEARPRRTEIALELSALPDLTKFVREFAAASHWDESIASRLDAVSEEILLTLLHRKNSEKQSRPRRLTVVARKDADRAMLEFTASTSEDHENFQDTIASIGEHFDEAQVEHEMSMRILHNYAASIRHQQFQDIEILTVHVQTSTRKSVGHL